MDITSNQMFSLYDYPIPGKCGLPLCEKHERQLKQKEVAIYEKEATEALLPGHYVKIGECANLMYNTLDQHWEVSWIN